MPRSDITFRSGSTTCAAWLYLPEGPTDRDRPMIVMAHGLAGVKEMRLDAFADRFVAAGYACLVFDYRHFGASGGEPRQLLDIRSQLEDWQAAVGFARNLDGVDPEQIIVWGTSFGGGHVIATAARDRRVAAVIAQCPFTDGLASSMAIPARTSLKLGSLALRDLARKARRRPPVTVPSFGPPGSTALMTAPDCEPGVLALMSEGLEARSDVAARFALQIARHFPGRQARHITCPALFVVCDLDSVAPPGATLRHVAKAPRGEVVRHCVGHFDIYVGKDFERNVDDQLAFLERHFPAESG